MKTKLLSLTLLAAGFAFGQVAVGISIGPPPAPRIFRTRPTAPGPGFEWIEGYWYPVANKYRWHEGYWTRAPYVGARWIGPRYAEGRFFEGRWDGDRGEVGHNHGWDRHRERDFRHEGRERR